MNQFGLTLAWLAVQVAVVLVPALALQALASRRSPTSGAWVATLSLGLVVVLGAVVFFPWAGPGIEPTSAGPVPSTVEGPPSAVDRSPLASIGAIDRPDPSSSGIGLSFDGLRRSWARMGRRATEPAERFRGWGKSLAIAFLVGAGLGSFRLLIGLWAVGLCRRSGRAVEDPAMIALVEELRNSMGCRPGVELLEVPDLTTPATAGWRRPMLLLPDDWRSWDESERRAVVAHELAHILRGDYAAGLLARVAVVLNYHHPLVRWMAARLQLEQELAADSMGARFSGGRSAYIVALSRLALRQDGRSPSWPARAFLPARGTLIRRIKMLRNETESRIPGQLWSRSIRLATALGLIALTFVVATLRSPARASDGPNDPVAETKAGRETAAVATPFELSYVPGGKMGVFAIRPAALVRRVGEESPLAKMMFGGDLSDLMNEMNQGKFKVDSSRPGFLKLGPSGIECVVAAFNIRKSKGPARGSKETKDMHQIEFGEAGGVTVRTVAPFDWLKFLGQWEIELEEVREPRGVYHKIKAPMMADMGLHVGIYLPDDRTLVYEKEELIKGIIAREVPSAPAYLRGPEWERVSRDLIAIAIDNHDDLFAKDYDLGRGDDKIVLSLLKGIDRWVLGLADRDSLAFHAEATGRGPDAVAGVANEVQGLVAFWLKALDVEAPATEKETPDARFSRGLLKNLKIEQRGRSLTAAAEAFGTMADLAAMIKADAEEAQAQAKEKTEAAEAVAKKVKR